MAHQIQSTLHGNHGALIPGIADFRDALLAAFSLTVLWYQRARERRQLNALDDRILADIGVTRAEVAREYDKPFWRA